MTLPSPTALQRCRSLRVGTGDSILGVSGGRTSGFLAHLVPSTTVLSFQNTGREHERTLEFLCRIEDALQRPIHRLEYRAPSHGERPRDATFVELSHRELARKGEPFRDMLECLAAFRRKEKGLGPLAPWAMSRLCTSYLKIKVQRQYVRTLGWYDYVDFVGYRADEPSRVALMRGRNDDRNLDIRAPLFDLGVTEADVRAFWRTQPYDLNLPPHLGNCTGCFMKDERDLADALAMGPTDAAWWIEIEADFGPMRRGGRPSYAQVYAEIPARRAIRAQLAAGVADGDVVADLPPARRRLVVRQERAERTAWSCGCAGAERLEDEDLLRDDLDPVALGEERE